MGWIKLFSLVWGLSLIKSGEMACIGQEGLKLRNRGEFPMCQNEGSSGTSGTYYQGVANWFLCHNSSANGTTKVVISNPKLGGWDLGGWSGYTFFMTLGMESWGQGIAVSVKSNKWGRSSKGYENFTPLYESGNCDYYGFMLLTF